MSYYQGDYYQGDFFKKIGKGLKRLGKNLKPFAPLAGVLMPAVGLTGLVAKGIGAVGRAQRISRAVRGVAAPNPNLSPILIASQMTGATVGIPSMAPVENKIYSSTGAAKTTRRVRTSIKKRKARAAYKRRRTTRRRYAR